MEELFSGIFVDVVVVVLCLRKGKVVAFGCWGGWTIECWGGGRRGRKRTDKGPRNLNGDKRKEQFYVYTIQRQCYSTIIK